MMNLLQYDFIVRGLIAGLTIALVAPLIGIFLVLRRYSLIADTLSHVSLAGIAIGLLFNINPLVTATLATVLSSTVIERLRSTKKVYGESALALMLSGSLALAIVLIGISHKLNANLFNYLFGSIATVSQNDIYTVIALGIVVLITIVFLYKELVFTTFDEEAAQVSGLPVKAINSIFIMLSAVTISLSIPIVGILLISALLVVPVITALQFGLGFIKTLLLAQVFAVISVLSGMILSFMYNLATGGTIVLVAMGIFFISWICTNRPQSKS